MKSVNNNIFEEGKDLILQEKYEEALKFFQDLYKEDQKNSIFLNYIGIIYLFMEDFKNAADYFKKAIEINPDNWYSYQKLGQICTLKNIDKCAIEYFTKTIERNPKNNHALINLALIFQKEDPNLAIDLTKAALEVEPSNLIANYFLGNIYLKNLNYKKAESLLEKVTLLDPKFLLGWYKLGLLYFKKGNSKKAIEVLINTLQISKKGYIYNLLGLAYLKIFKFQLAIECFKKAIKLDPKDPSPWINLADAYLNGDKIDSSMLCLKEALQIAKSDYQYLTIWTNYANCYEKLNQLDFSLFCFEKALLYGGKTSDSILESFNEVESKMEIIHRINKKIDQIKKKAITARCPEDLN